MSLDWNSRAEGIDDVEAFFEYAGYKARDMREPLGEAKAHIQFLMEMAFLTEGEYRSGGWVPLTEDYELWKLGRTDETMLKLTTEMSNIVLADESWSVTMLEADFHPPSEKAGWHQEGVASRTRGGTLPARPILELWEEDYSAIEGYFEDWLDELRSVNIRRGVVDAALRPSIFG